MSDIGKLITRTPLRKLRMATDGSFIILQEREFCAEGIDGDRRRKWTDVRVLVHREELAKILGMIDVPDRRQ